MAFIVENGTGISNATSYVSETAFDAYWTDRGNTAAVALVSATKKELLIKATAWVDATFRLSFKGQKGTQTQALQWPRSGVEIDGFALDTNIIPAELINAVSELAWKATTENIFADVKSGAGFRTETTVGPITLRFAPGYSATTLYSFITKLLAALLRSTGNVVEVIRS